MIFMHCVLLHQMWQRTFNSTVFHCVSIRLYRLKRLISKFGNIVG